MSLTSDAITVGVIGIAAVIGANLLKNPVAKAIDAGAGAVSGTVGAVVQPIVDYFKANNTRAIDNATDMWFNGAEGINLFGLTIGAYDPCDWTRFRGTYIASFGTGADPGEIPTEHFAYRCNDYQTRKGIIYGTQ